MLPRRHEIQQGCARDVLVLRRKFMEDEAKGLVGSGGGQDLAKEGTDEGGGEAGDDFSWEDAAADPAKQRDMIRQEVGKEASKSIREASNFRSADSESGGAGQNSLNFILDIPLQLTVELGRAKMFIKDLLHLNQGSIIELTKLVGEPLEIMVNNKLIGKGEVVVVNDKFGVKLIDIMSPVERVEQLK